MTRGGGILALTAIAVVWGVLAARRLAWTSDDAYISFRYADHLVRGLGLVFNAGERVEGYSNFLWTVWCALGLRLGFGAEGWANASSIVCHALTIATLGAFTWLRHRDRRGVGVPVAAILVALHRDFAVFATGGLETALVTLLAVLGYVLLAAPGAGTRRRLTAAGTVLGLAAITRPDGILFGTIGALFVAWDARPRLAATLAYAAPLALIAGLFAAWKLAYYGDLLPNTYYAKSANLAWYSQGWSYLLLYAQKYWVAMLGPVLALAAWARVRRAADATATSGWRPAAALAAACALLYTWYVVRVGGDFMFARLLIPATPFYLVLLEIGLERLVGERRRALVPATALAAGAIAFTPYPFRGEGWVNGIVDERQYYADHDRGHDRALGLTLRRCFEGLPIRVAFTGTQAILAYYSRAPLAIEATAGLTDSAIAHQPLHGRGRVGHEKRASYEYLLDRRKVHLILSAAADMPETLSRYIPVGRIEFDGTPMMVLRWDPPVMRELRRRGAKVEDFEPALDAYLQSLDSLPDSVVRADYERIRRFYFDAVTDPAREAAFLRRLRRPATAP